MTPIITDSFLSGSHQHRLQILMTILPAGFRSGPIRTTSEPLWSKIRLIQETFILFHDFMIKTSLELNLNFVIWTSRAENFHCFRKQEKVFQSFSVLSWTQTRLSCSCMSSHSSHSWWFLFLQRKLNPSWIGLSSEGGFTGWSYFLRENIEEPFCLYQFIIKRWRF